MKDLIAKLEADVLAAICGPTTKPRQTALRVRGNSFESVEIDDAGNIIEPPKPCRRCGPLIMCSFHMGLVT